MPSDVPALSRRRALQLLGGTVALAVSAAVFGTDGPTDGDADAADQPVTEQRHYRGAATTRIVGDDETPRPRRSDVRVVIVPPVDAAAGSGPPFDLRIDAADDGGALGPARLVTAAGGPDAARGRVDRHWEVRLDDAGGFAGVLRSADAEANALSSRRELVPGRPATAMPVTEAMAPGTTLSGVLTPTTLSLRVRGNTVNGFADDLLDRSRPFETAIRATREARS